MAATASFALEMLLYSFENAADWRRQKAEQYPAYAASNLHAASALDRLAATVADIHPDYTNAYLELNEGDEADMSWSTELEREMIKQAGFNRQWQSAEEFVKEIIAKLTGGLR